MTSIKKPLLAVLALLAALAASVLFVAGPASAAPPNEGRGTSPVITVNPSNPRCGSTVTVSGSGYKPGKVVTVTAVSQLPSAWMVLSARSTTPKDGSNRKLVNIPVEMMSHSVAVCERSRSRTSNCSSNKFCGLPRPIRS